MDEGSGTLIAVLEVWGVVTLEELVAMAEGEPVISEALKAVLRSSELPSEIRKAVAGYDFNNGLNLEALLASMLSTGFQAAHLGQAVVEVNRMVSIHLLSALES